MSVGNSTASGVGVAVGNDWAEVTIGAEGVEVKLGGPVVPTQAVSIIVTTPAITNAPRELMSHYLKIHVVSFRREAIRILLLIICSNLVCDSIVQRFFAVNYSCANTHKA